MKRLIHILLSTKKAKEIVSAYFPSSALPVLRGCQFQQLVRSPEQGCGRKCGRGKRWEISTAVLPWMRSEKAKEDLVFSAGVEGGGGLVEDEQAGHCVGAEWGDLLPW